MLGLCHVGYEYYQVECLHFGLGEGSRIIERWIMEQFDSTFGGASHIDYLSFVLFMRAWDLPLLGSRDVRFDHLRWIDDAVELVLRHEPKLQRCGLQREVVVQRVVLMLRCLVVANDRRERRHQHQRPLAAFPST